MKMFNTYLALVAIVILSMLMSSCAAIQVPPLYDMLPIQPGSTLYGMAQAMKGAVGTAIFSKNGVYLITWSMKDSGAAYAVINGKYHDFETAIREFEWLSRGRGTLTTWDNFDIIRKSAAEQGWAKIPYTAVPIALRSAVTATAVIQGFTSAAMPTFFFIPATIIQGLMENPLNVINPEIGA